MEINRRSFGQRLAGFFSLVPFFRTKIKPGTAKVAEHDSMGDTAIEWAWGVADIAYNTHAFSPRSERMRKDIVQASFNVLRDHYDPGMKWENYWGIVTKRIKTLQERDAQKVGRGTLIGTDRANARHQRSIESLFDTNRTDLD